MPCHAVCRPGEGLFSLSLSLSLSSFLPLLFSKCKQPRHFAPLIHCLWAVISVAPRRDINGLQERQEKGCVVMGDCGVQRCISFILLQPP